MKIKIYHNKDNTIKVTDVDENNGMETIMYIPMGNVIELEVSNFSMKEGDISDQ